MLMSLGAAGMLIAGVFVGSIVNNNFGRRDGAPSIMQTPSASPTVSPQISAPVAPNLPVTLILNINNGNGTQRPSASLPMSASCELIPQQNETILSERALHEPKITEIEDEAPPESPSFFSSIVPRIANSPWVSLLQNNALPLIAGPSVCGSFYTFLLLRRAEQFLQKPAAWFNWKRGVPLEQYSAMERDEIAPYLIQSIQKRYTTAHNAYDFVQPLKLFLADINNETKQLEKFIRITTWLERLHISALFGVNKVYVDQAKNNIVRLEALKRMFTGWATEQKIERSLSRRRA